MSLTKEMIMQVDTEVKIFTDEELLIYNRVYKDLNHKHPNSYFGYKIQKSEEEIFNRGLE